MHTKIQHTSRILRHFISSQAFFLIIFGYFIISSIWLAFTALYPMAFDEEFHWGIINIYANQWSPFLVSHPEHAEGLSAVARDPSFLFHYLMSFPLKFVRLFTDSQDVQIIVLRLLNVALLATAFPIYRRFFDAAKLSRFVSHTVLALFALVPIVPFLAAHINYDNLMIPLAGVSLLLGYSVTVDWKKGLWSPQKMLLLVLVVMVASLVKYTYLPFALGIFLYMVAVLIIAIRSRRLTFDALLPSVRSVRRNKIIVVIAAIVLCGVLFGQRYGVNFVQYGTPLPSCDQVLTEAQCQTYGPWARDTQMARSLPDDFSPDGIEFMKKWFSGMWKRSLFAIASKENAYENYPPLPVLGWGVIVLAATGAVLLLAYSRRIFTSGRYTLMLVVSVTYAVIVLAENFLMYRETGNFVAINGRYLLPILPLVFALYARAYGEAARRFKSGFVLPIMVSFILALVTLQGGGSTGWIANSNRFWYRDNESVRIINRKARGVLVPLIIGAEKR